MTINRWRQRKLEDIANGINGLKKDSLTHKLKRAFYLVPVTAFAGALDGKSQEEYMEKIGYKKEHAKYLTIANAAVFGLGTSWIWYHGGRESSEYTKGLAEILRVSAGFLTYSYIGINAVQSIGRIFYSSITGKPLISLTPTGIGGTLVKKIIDGLKKTKKSL